jgi:hypothetical protein
MNSPLHPRPRGPKLLRTLAPALALVAVAFFVSGAAANDVTAIITCSCVTINAVNFPNAPGNTIHETISVDGIPFAMPTLTFDGPSGSNTVCPNLTSGDHIISVSATWNTNGASGQFTTQQAVSCGNPPPPGCTIIGSINSNFNGTAIVGVGAGQAFIWFNSNISLKNQPAGAMITLTGSQVTINGTAYDVPDAKITFAAVSCATTSFDAGSNTWLTTVPLAGSDEIFLSGAAIPVTSLPGGAKVTWQGTFGTNQPGICFSWKWGAAAYKQFSADYNDANIKPSHQAACGINNGDHAGTPQNPTIRASVTGGARGGGGSNFTGSWSATGSLCPVCPPGDAGAVGVTAIRTVPRLNGGAPQALSFAIPGPNPTTGSTALTFTLPRAASVSISVYDVSGRQLRQVANGSYGAGTHATSWDLLDRDGNRVSRGIYFVRLATLGQVLSHTVIVER